MFLTDTPLSAASLLSEAEASFPNAGAIVSFSGIVRPQNAAGERVTGLYLEAYSPMTERGIAAALADALDRWPLDGARIMHRIGEMAPGETIVFVATASAHRRAAFEAADFLMDFLKTRAVFWKKETGPAGSVWVEPRTEDYDDAERWTREQGASDARHQ